MHLIPDLSLLIFLFYPYLCTFDFYFSSLGDARVTFERGCKIPDRGPLMKEVDIAVESSLISYSKTVLVQM